MSTTKITNFNPFARNINSQFGEDGIIEEILSRVDKVRAVESRYCVEFGAWDGKYLSNTYNLIAERNYQAVLIEADPVKFELLCKNIPQSSVRKINRFVTFDGPTTLDGLLSETDIPINFDLLSIDIDGNDYHILASLKKYHPILICIEFNPTIPNAVEYVQPRDFLVKRGASARAIASLASSMGYAVVASTHCNLFLLDRDYIPKVDLLREPTLEEVRDDEDTRRYVFCGYDGTILLSDPLNMPWHGLNITGKELQTLPPYLRRFPDDHNGFQRIGLQLLRAFRQPKNAYWTIRKKFSF